MSDATDPKMNPWVPMSVPRDIKTLGKLQEENGELGAALARCLIQGIDACEPVTGKPNRLWLTEEIADVAANIALVIERFNLDSEFISARMERKMAQLRTWHEMLP